ncbi:MAG TPA: hypothetical protein PKI59_05545 [Candidatus Cloacimonadota bacterium]|nr:hypothetical protein [Candidatus Cloacimonadota bacterium]
MSLTRLHFTESGYLMLVKSLTDDLSWAVQRELVNSYFRANLLEQVLGFLPAATRKLIYYRSLGLTQKDTASLLISNADQHLGGQCLWILHKKLDEDIDKLEAIIGAKISVALDQELIRM